jgi:hypothetical protein
VTAQEFLWRNPWSARADANGRLRFFWSNREKMGLLWMASRDETAAVGLAEPPAPPQPNEWSDVRLRPMRPVEVLLADQLGHALTGAVAAYYMERPDGPRLLVSQSRGGQGMARLRIPGLAPGVKYALYGTTPTATEDAPGAEWTFPVGDPNPSVKLTIRLPEPLAAPAVPARPFRPQDDFANQVAGLKDALWKKEDPVQNNLTWYADKNGIVLADAAGFRVRRFDNLFGYNRIQAAAIVFTKDKVWVGTNIGLMAWDRADQFWSRFAAGATLVDAPVTQLELVEGRKLRVTFTQANARPKAYVYDIATGRWQGE